MCRLLGQQEGRTGRVQASVLLTQQVMGLSVLSPAQVRSPMRKDCHGPRHGGGGGLISCTGVWGGGQMLEFDQLQPEHEKLSQRDQAQPVQDWRCLIMQKLYLSPPASALGLHPRTQEPGLHLGAPGTSPDSHPHPRGSLLGLSLSPYLLLPGPCSPTLSVFSSVKHTL